MKRIVLFIVTNLAVILILSIVLRLLGVDRILDEQGIALEMTNLLVFAAVFGFGGAFVSLALSKWTALRMTGARVITQPANETEAWLVNTVKRQATAGGSGCPTWPYTTRPTRTPSPQACAATARWSPSARGCCAR